METNILDYALTAILSIINKENEVHLVTFHFYTFTVVELNYNTYDRELLVIFKAFKFWQHYLEGLAYPIDIVTDHKNLKYFYYQGFNPKTSMVVQISLLVQPCYQVPF